MVGVTADLSVVIVTYQSDQHIGRCLDSVRREAAELASTCVVVDNGSSDRTCQIVEQDYPDVLLVRNTLNRGFAAAANQAIRCCTSPFVLLLNPDAELIPGSLRPLMEALAADGSAVAAGPQLLHPSGGPQVSARPQLSSLIVVFESLMLDRLFPQSPLVDVRPAGEQPEKVECLSGACLLLRKREFEDLGGFDESFFLYGEDVDLCLRARQRQRNLWLVPLSRVIHLIAGSARQDEKSFFRELHRAKARLVRKHSCGAARWALLTIQAAGLCLRSFWHACLGLCSMSEGRLRTARHELGASFGVLGLLLESSSRAEAPPLHPSAEVGLPPSD